MIYSSCKVKRILTYGSFDMFHIGHLNLLRTLAEIGDEVVVGVSTDEFNLIKGKRSLMPYDQRAAIVESIRYVDLVIPETSWEQKVSDVEKYQIDVFAIGQDWAGEFDFLKNYCEVVYLPRTEGVSTTELKRSLKSYLSIPHEDLLRAFEVLEMLRRDLE